MDYCNEDLLRDCVVSASQQVYRNMVQRLQNGDPLGEIFPIDGQVCCVDVLCLLALLTLDRPKMPFNLQ